MMKSCCAAKFASISRKRMSERTGLKRPLMPFAFWPMGRMDCDEPGRFDFRWQFVTKTLICSHGSFATDSNIAQY